MDFYDHPTHRNPTPSSFMKTLATVLSQITPLPYGFDLKGHSVVAGKYKLTHHWHGSGNRQEMETTAQYLSHAANALPELVKCIKAHSAAVLAFDVAKAEWKSNPTEDNKAILRRMSLKQSHAHDALQSAIARAERVE